MNPFLIIGGYGTVGTETIKALRKFQPNLPLVIAGRDRNKAEAAANAHGIAVGVAVDTSRPDLGLPDAMQLSGIALLTNDLSTHPAKYAVTKGIPYTSIATQLVHLAPKLAVQIAGMNKSASLLQDTSFAGTLVLAALQIIEQFSRVDTITIGAVMDDQDLGGPASQSDAADFEGHAPAFLIEGGAWVKPDSNEGSRTFQLLDGSTCEGASFPSFDVPELSARFGAQSIRLDFSFAETPGRRLHGQPSVEIIYDIAGLLTDGEAATVTVQLSHPRGQTVLTGIGVAVGIEELLGLREKKATPPGLYLPSTLIDPTHMTSRLKEAGAVFQGKIAGAQGSRAFSL